VTEGDTLFEKVSPLKIAKYGAEMDLFSPKVTLLAKIEGDTFRENWSTFVSNDIQRKFHRYENFV